MTNDTAERISSVNAQLSADADAGDWGQVAALLEKRAELLTETQTLGERRILIECEMTTRKLLDAATSARAEISKRLVLLRRGRSATERYTVGQLRK